MAKRQKNWPQILAKVLATNISQCDIVIVCLAVLVQVPFFARVILMPKHWMEFLECPNGSFMMRVWTAGPWRFFQEHEWRTCRKAKWLQKCMRYHKLLKLKRVKGLKKVLKLKKKTLGSEQMYSFCKVFSTLKLGSLEVTWNFGRLPTVIWNCSLDQKI